MSEPAHKLIPPCPDCGCRVATTSAVNLHLADCPQGGGDWERVEKLALSIVRDCRESDKVLAYAQDLALVAARHGAGHV